jgi:hypothetical protein
LYLSIIDARFSLFQNSEEKEYTKKPLISRQASSGAISMQIMRFRQGHFVSEVSSITI